MTTQATPVDAVLGHLDAARPLPTTIAHLDALVATGAEGWLVVSALVPGAGRNGGPGWLSRSFRHDQVDAAAVAVATADERGLNVYVRTNLLARPLARPTERGRTEDTGAAVALAVDLDVDGPGHQPGHKLPLPPDLDTAMGVVAELPEPTLTVHTGGGLHLWWILDEPELDRPVELLDGWADRIVEAGRLRGWHVDRPDPARVLRVCGTHRRKPGVTPNRVVLAAAAGWPTEWNDIEPWYPRVRYGAADLLEVLPAPLPPEPAPGRPPRPAGEVGPADAAAQLPWATILQPAGWTYVGTGTADGQPVELWRRPGDPTSDYSIKCFPHAAVAWSEACGLPTGRGQKLTKWRVLVALHYGGDEVAAARTIRARHRELTR